MQIVSPSFFPLPALLILMVALWAAPIRGCTADAIAFQGCCDASAAVSLDARHVAVANDEDNLLRVYRQDQGGQPVSVLDLAPTLGGPAEADFEGGARVGDLAFWIGSHSRANNGRLRPARQVVVATRVQVEGDRPQIVPVGRAFRGLLAALIGEPSLRSLEFGRAASLAPEARGGLNIEGLAEGPDGSLVLGFRNPVPEGRALLVPWLNPSEAVLNGARPRLGAAWSVDLEGLGIRSLAWSQDGWVVVAGPAEGGGRHRLFRVDGGGTRVREWEGAIPKGFQAESMVVNDGAQGGRITMFSDDDSRKIGGKRCDTLADARQRAFRALHLAWPETWVP
jgi:hypothetical protein